MEVETQISRIEELSIFNKSNIDANNIPLFIIDNDSYSQNKAYFELLIIIVFSLLLLNFIYLLTILLKIGYNQNQNRNINK